MSESTISSRQALIRLNDRAKEEAVVALIGAAWLSNIAPLNTPPHSNNSLYYGIRNGKKSAIIHVACYDDDGGYTNRIPVSLFDWAWYQQLRLTFELPIILTVLIGTECKFACVNTLNVYDEREIVLVDDVPYFEAHISCFRHVGQILPRSETQYAD